MRAAEIHQFLPVLSPRDAVGNTARFARDALSKAGFTSHIWAEEINQEIGADASPFQAYRPARRRNAVLHMYQASTGSKHGLVEFLLRRPEPKTLWYHNITPAEYFAQYDATATETLEKGRRELQALASQVESALSDSEFNAAELRELGIGDVTVIPPFLTPAVAPDPRHVEWIKNTKRGIDVLFVGRIVPNKGHHHLLRTFKALTATVDPHARLFVVGAWGPPAYIASLFEARRKLNLDRVTFTGSCSASALAAYYEGCDIFLSLSEHEGFGLPLVEAMRARIPVIAFDAGAVRETMGSAGIVTTTLDPLHTAELVGRVASDTGLRESIVRSQQLRADEVAGIDREALIISHVSSVLGQLASAS